MELPPQAKSFEGRDTAGDLVAGAFAEAWAGVGSGVAHASLEPHASVSPKPENELLAFEGAIGAGLGCGGAGVERLNAELRLIEGAEGF